MAKKYVIRRPDEIVPERKNQRKKETVIDEVCEDCIHIIPSDKYLSVAEKKPLLGECPFSVHMRLLSDKPCNKFESKKENEKAQIEPY